jgi:hypothetical protein
MFGLKKQEKGDFVAENAKLVMENAITQAVMEIREKVVDDAKEGATKSVREVMNAKDSVVRLKQEKIELEEEKAKIERELKKLKSDKKVEETEIKALVKVTREKADLEFQQKEIGLQKEFNQKELELTIKFQQDLLDAIKEERIRLDEFMDKVMLRLTRVNNREIVGEREIAKD